MAKLTDTWRNIRFHANINNGPQFLQFSAHLFLIAVGHYKNKLFFPIVVFTDTCKGLFPRRSNIYKDEHAPS